MAMDINSPIAIAACAVRMDNDASYFGEPRITPEGDWHHCLV
jgi:hypothetical protein